jgi:hypothetical protein
MNSTYRKIHYGLILVLPLIFSSCDGILNSRFLGDSEKGTLSLSINLPNQTYNTSLLVSISDTSKVFYFPAEFYNPVISPTGKKIILHDIESGTFDSNALVLYIWGSDSIIYLKDTYGNDVLGDKVIWGPAEDRIYFDVPGSSSWSYCYFEFKTKLWVFYNGFKPALDFIDANTILTYYTDEYGYYRPARMDREGNIIGDINNPYLISTSPGQFSKAWVSKYSASLDLFVGGYIDTSYARNYYGIIATNDNGSIFNIITNDEYIDSNPVFGFHGQTIYFERKEDILVDPDNKNWIMKYHFNDNRLQMQFPVGSFNGAENINLIDFSESLILN